MFSSTDFFSKTAETADLVTFTEKIFNGKLHFLCSVCSLLLIHLPFSPLAIKCNNNEKGHNYNALLAYLTNYILELELILKNYKINSRISKAIDL